MEVVVFRSSASSPRNHQQTTPAAAAILLLQPTTRGWSECFGLVLEDSYVSWSMAQIELVLQSWTPKTRVSTEAFVFCLYRMRHYQGWSVALLVLSGLLGLLGLGSLAQKLPTRDEGLFQMQIQDKSLFHDSSVIPDGAEISGYLFRDTPKR